MDIASNIRRTAGLVMDPERNPLRAFHLSQRFQIMLVLSVMWSTIFCASFSVWYLYGELVVGHALVIFGVLVTGLTFSSAGPRTRTYRDYPRDDGTARYDDVWGG